MPPLTLFTTRSFANDYGDGALALVGEGGLELLILPEGDGARIDTGDLARVTLAYFTSDILKYENLTRRFFGSAMGAPNLRWLHLPHAGVDHPVYARFRERGVRLTTSSGASSEPIAQSAIAGLLTLARRFPLWAEQQRRHEWRQLLPPEYPPDLRGQTMLLVGVGAIGGHIARLAQALGLRVIGIRRSPKLADEPLDEIFPPGELSALAPRADWLVLACPLTEETRGLIDREIIERLPTGAHIINVARGEIIDESALIDALQSGRIAGAYLDVFVNEPLLPDSPLWDLPNVLVSPHDSGAARGNSPRASEMFLENLRRWLRNEPLNNEV